MPENFSLKDKIQEILVASKYDQKRARTMDMDDFIAYEHIYWIICLTY